MMFFLKSHNMADSILFIFHIYIPSTYLHIDIRQE